MDEFTLVIIAIYVVVGAVVITLWSVQRYQLALFIIAVSPLATTSLMANDVDADLEPGLGSYVRIGIVLLAGTAGAVFFLRSKPRQSIPRHLVLLGVFVSMALASTGYSLDPKFTFVRAASSGAVFAFLLGLHYWLKDEERLRGVMETLLVTTVLGVAVNGLAGLLWPERAWLYVEGARFQGLLGHPNQFGGFCMLSYPVLFWKYPRCTTLGKWLLICVGVVTVCLHLLTGSRGSLLPSAVLICVWFFAMKQWARLICVAGVLAVAGILVVTLMPSKFKREDNADLTGLTGRPEFWQASMELVMERPLQGYGYAVEGKVWNDPRFNKPDFALWSGSAKASLHNGYLSAAIGGGLPALAIWFTLLIIPLSRALNSPLSGYRAFVLSVIVTSLVRNFVEDQIQATAASSGITFWVAWVIAGHDVLRGWVTAASDS
ncbi:MAG: hypothetical protein DMG15_09435 [Acidobacteria bacterium]|nr:MAG: hypothetical protein DMG15_09435 [Acidobacteriota bacterium]